MKKICVPLKKNEKGMKFNMIILDKKRLGIIAGILLVAVFVFTFQTANVRDTVQTVSLPVSSKVIVLDAGHRKAR